MILSVLTDIYMFMLFFRAEGKEKAEKELRQLKYLYDLEKIRYEELEKEQEEMAKIRHDFQNYILVLQNMTQKTIEERGQAL